MAKNYYRERVIQSLLVEAKKLDALGMPGMASDLRKAAEIYRANWHAFRNKKKQKRVTQKLLDKVAI
jgi:hypothetical protein